MAKVLRCNDLVPGCKFEARGVCEEEVIAEFADHIATVHNMFEISDQALATIRKAIHEEVRVRALRTRAEFGACQQVCGEKAHTMVLLKSLHVGLSRFRLRIPETLLSHGGG